MQLPGRLKSTTLGDLLGTLHRARASGTLELECGGARCHRVHMVDGLVVAVELDGAAASLAEFLRREHAVDEDVLRRSLLRALASRRLHGEVLVRDFSAPAPLVSRALHAQAAARLAMLERIGDAQVRFHVMVKPPRGSMSDAPLEPRDFLAGKRRARDRAASAPPKMGRSIDAPPAAAGAWRVLGVPPGSAEQEVKRAYRHLARTYHPDLHPNATDEERKQLALRFAEVTAAYRTLVA
jgi:hypothetical protein